MTNVFSEVGTFFTNLWDNVLKPDVQEAEQVAIAFFSAAATAVATQLGTVGLKIVTDAVTAAQATGGTGTEKLAAAQAKILSDLSTAGVSAATNVINAAIEGAVAQLNTITAVTTGSAAPLSASTDPAPVTAE